MVSYRVGQNVENPNHTSMIYQILNCFLLTFVLYTILHDGGFVSVYIYQDSR